MSYAMKVLDVRCCSALSLELPILDARRANVLFCVFVYRGRGCSVK